MKPYEGILSRKLKVLNILCIQRTPETAQPAIDIELLARKNDSNEHELGTESVCSVVPDKSYYISRPSVQMRAP